MKVRVFYWEWDMENGEYVHRDLYGTVVDVKDEDELYKKISRWLEEDVRDAEKNGWTCDPHSDGLSAVCSKVDKECVEELKNEGYDEDEAVNRCSMSVQIGYDIENI